MVYRTPLTLKEITNVTLNEIILIYMCTLKIGPKSYEHSLNIPSSHSDIFYFLNIKITTVILKN